MKKIFLLEISIALVLYLFFWESTLFSPIRVFFVSIHESMHAIATILTGGGVESIGLTGYEGVMRPSHNGFVPIVAVAGYLGSALVGGFLIATKHKTSSLVAVSLFVAIFMVVFIDSYFSLEFIGVSIIVGLIIFAAFKDFHLELISGVIGSLLAFGSVQDVKMYLIRIPGETDAGILANYLGIPSLTLPISIFMLLITLLIYYIALKYRMKHNPSAFVIKKAKKYF